MAVADTTALLALLDHDHPRHHDARQALARGPISVTWGALAETTTVVRRLAKNRGKDGGPIARQALEQLRVIPGFRPAPLPSLPDVAAVYGRESTLSFADAWAVVTALQLTEPLVTYDAQLAKAAARAGVPLHSQT